MKSIKTLLAVALIACGLLTGCLTGCATSKQLSNINDKAVAVVQETAAVGPEIANVATAAIKDFTSLYGKVVDWVANIGNIFKSAPAPVPVAQ